MKDKQIISQLKILYPEARKICRDPLNKNVWTVYVVDEFEESSFGYCVRNGELSYVGSVVSEI